jgi:hypothetical protein
MAAIYSNEGNRWNILGFIFTKRDALSSVYKISMTYNGNSRVISIFVFEPKHTLLNFICLLKEPIFISNNP